MASTPNGRRRLCHAGFKTYIRSNEHVAGIVGVGVVVYAFHGLDFTFVIA